MRKGQKMTIEQRNKIRKAHQGKKYPNRKLSITRRANIAKARKKEWASGKRKFGIKFTPEVLEKIRLSRVGKKTPIEVRKKQSLVRLNNPKTPRGDKHHFWKGGLRTETQKIRASFEMRIWREAVFRRDNWTCIFCGIRGTRLHADHIKPFALFPELRFAIDNGRTLCVPCHLKTDTWGYRIKNYVK